MPSPVLSSIPGSIETLESLTVGELQELYAEVFGVPTRSSNKGHLRKRIAHQWHVQAEGGLSAEAKARLALLQTDPATAEAPFRWIPVTAPAPPPRRDPRLPPVGTVLQRHYRGETHAVTVHGNGFMYRGTVYPNLSRVATAITGTKWNGYAFFGLARSKTTRRTRKETSR